MSDTTTTLPVSIGPEGFIPQTPAQILATLLANVAATNPDYTANLPGLLIEDISSTDVAAIALCQSALQDLVNSISPATANEYVMLQLGNVYGIGPTAASNTSVYIEAFSSTPGFVIPQGFTCSDGTYQYVTQEVGIVSADGTSGLIFCLATVAGTFTSAPSTVNQAVTSIPSGVTLYFNNPQAAIPGQGAESYDSFRARVLQAVIAPAQGMASYLKSQLAQVPGVQPRLVSVQQQPNNGGWKIIVGGGDPYQVALAIYNSLFDVDSIVGSSMNVLNITRANPGVVTTQYNHGYNTGELCVITGIVGMTALNGVDLDVTVIDEKTFSIGINTSSYAAYVSGGVCEPNTRNIVVSINNYPDTYLVPFVVPPQQTVTVTLTWDTNSPNYVNPAAISQATQGPIAAYINSIPATQPINILEINSVFQLATVNLVPTNFISRINVVVYINGIETDPTENYSLVFGDGESYFETTPAAITVNQA